MRRSFSVPTAAVLAGSLALGWASLARADVAPPDTDGCRSTAAGSGGVDLSKAGTSCQTDTGAAGKCTTSKCSRLDYANWDRDASPAPPSVEYDCLKCTAGGATAADGGGVANDGGTTAGNSKSGCNVSGTARSAAPWLLALAVALVVSSRRKRNAS